MSNSTNIVRIACDLSLPNRKPVNEIDGLQVSINRGKAYCFEIGIFDKETWQETISQFASVNLQVRLTRTSTAIIDVTTVVAALTVARSAWDGRTSQHVQIQVTGTQTGALAVPAPFYLSHWMSLSATTTGGAVVTLAAGSIQAIEDGAQFSGSSPVAGDPAYLTADQTASLVASAVGRGRILSADGLWEIVIDVDPDDHQVRFNAKPA